MRSFEVKSITIRINRFLRHALPSSTAWTCTLVMWHFWSGTITVSHYKQTSVEEIWQKAASPTCHRSVHHFWTVNHVPKMSTCHPSQPVNRLVRSSPHLISGSLSPQQWAPKRHLSRLVQFSHFTQHIHMNNTQTDTPADHATCDICSNRPYLMHCV